MADRLAAGELAAILRQERGEGKGYEAICRKLFADHGIEVTGQTIANWCDALGIEKASA